MRTHTNGDIAEVFGALKEGESSEEKIRACGRVMTRRLMGRAAFFHFHDESGALQGYIKLDNLDKEGLTYWKAKILVIL